MPSVVIGGDSGDNSSSDGSGNGENIGGGYVVEPHFTSFQAPTFFLVYNLYIYIEHCVFFVSLVLHLFLHAMRYHEGVCLIPHKLLSIWFFVHFQQFIEFLVVLTSLMANRNISYFEFQLAVEKFERNFYCNLSHIEMTK